MKEALKLALEALKKVYDNVSFYGEVREAIAAIEAVLAQPEQNLNCKSVQARLATAWGYVKAEQEPMAWVTKEQLLQDWLPRLWDALKDVRHNENASAQETLYELYVEMEQQTISEKIDTMSL